MSVRRQRTGLIAALAATLALILPASAPGASPAEGLRAELTAEMAQAPERSGALVVDMTTGETLFSDRAERRLQSASIMKLYTTSTALLRLSPRARLATRVYGTGRRVGRVWRGDVYLRGAGDFTFGTAGFRRSAYGGGGSVEALAAQLRRAGIARISGTVYADASLFRDNGGNPFGLVLCPRPLFGPGCPYGPAGRFERPLPNGPRTPIGLNRGLVGARSVAPQAHPVRFAARTFAAALRRQGIAVRGGAGGRRTPARATHLARAPSPSIARFALLVNHPSDNYAAAVLQRVIAVRSGAPGTRAAGARITEREIGRQFGIAPRVYSGAGEDLRDRTSPREVVTLLDGMRGRKAGGAFLRSLSLAGRSGGLLHLRGTAAAGRCRLKDGTRVDELPNTTLNLAGYCRSAGGHDIAFAIMMNGIQIEFVPPTTIVSPAYKLQDAMVSAIASYGG